MKYIVLILLVVAFLGFVSADIISTNIDTKTKIEQQNTIALDVQTDYPDAVTSSDIKISTNQTVNVTKRIASFYKNGTVIFKNVTLKVPIYDTVTEYKIDYNQLTLNLESEIKLLKEENLNLKTELCTKDNSYSWCKDLGLGGGIIGL